MRELLKRLPEWIKAPLRRVRNLVRVIQYRGNGRLCPVCKKSSRVFAPFGQPPRKDAMCPHCGALERHRLLWLYLIRETNLFDGKAKKVLHVAPEPCFETIFRQRLGDCYITADLSNPRVMVKMDVTDINYPDEYFDVILCSHVLEHVQDDKKAIREFWRTLKRDGWAILLVPITNDVTFEDPTIIDPKERLRIFGQENHVRRYGRDYIDRLRAAGFNVKVTTATELIQNNEEITRLGLTPASGEIYYCTKQGG